MIVAGASVNLSDRERRFFGEAPDRVKGKAFRIERVAHALDVAVASFGTSRRNTQDNHAAFAARNLQCGTHDDAIAFGIGDVMISREYGHERVATRGVTHVQSCKGNRGGGIASDRLGQDAATRCGRQLLFDFGGLLGIGDRPNARRRD